MINRKWRQNRRSNGPESRTLTIKMHRRIGTSHVHGTDPPTCSDTDKPHVASKVRIYRWLFEAVTWPKCYKIAYFTIYNMVGGHIHRNSWNCIFHKNMMFILNKWSHKHESPWRSLPAHTTFYELEGAIFVILCNNIVKNEGFTLKIQNQTNQLQIPIRSHYMAQNLKNYIFYVLWRMWRSYQVRRN